LAFVGCAVEKYTLWSAKRFSISVGSGIDGGGGGGASTFTVVEVFAERLRSSVTVLFTVTDDPGWAPVVFNVAFAPLGVSWPALAW
jgi:hypothetical protein